MQCNSAMITLPLFFFLFILILFLCPILLEEWHRYRDYRYNTGHYRHNRRREILDSYREENNLSAELHKINVRLDALETTKHG